MSGGPIVEGYAFVPLADTVNRVRRPHGLLDLRLPGHLFGSVTVTFVAEQPVHVGSGYKRLVNDKVVRAMVSRNGTPIVPGSSMKGALRARFQNS